jgi:hypothetical protein
MLVTGHFTNGERTSAVQEIMVATLFIAVF